MIVKISKKIGNTTLQFEVEGSKAKDALSSASQFTTMPEKCDLCQSTELMLDSNKSDSFTFVKIRCLKCDARSGMGEFKDGSGIFWKKFEKWEGSTEKEADKVFSK